MTDFLNPDVLVYHQDALLGMQEQCNQTYDEFLRLVQETGGANAYHSPEGIDSGLLNRREELRQSIGSFAARGIEPSFRQTFPLAEPDS